MALGDKCVSGLETVLVPRADKLDCCNQAPSVPLVVYPDFVLGGRQFVGVEQDSWRSGLPFEGGIGGLVVAGASHILQLERYDIDFDSAAEMDFDPTPVIGWEKGIESNGNDSRPQPVKFFPRSDIGHKRSKVVAQWHGSSSTEIVSRHTGK
jgi:hypothetical protein